jgi:hypothetical protein
MKYKYFIFFSIFILCQSCKTAYIPSALNVPLLQEKGELKITLSPTNYQVAYSISKKLGVMANGQVASSTTTFGDGITNSDFKQTNSAFELGAGYLGKGGRNLLYELYGGIGLIKADIVDSKAGQILGTYEANGLKFFIQPNIGFTSKAFDIAFSTRFTGLQFGTSTTIFSKQYLLEKELDELSENTHLFLEPAITLRGGYKFIKLQTQIGLSAKLSTPNIPYNAFIGSVGLQIDIAKWYNN